MKPLYPMKTMLSSVSTAGDRSTGIVDAEATKASERIAAIEESPLRMANQIRTNWYITDQVQ